MPNARLLISLLLCLHALLGSLARAAPPAPESIAGREGYVYLPAKLPPAGSRALVIVLHGGLGNAQRVATGRNEGALNLNAVADSGGFVVAYLNGTPVARALGANMLGWNAGACCGLPAERQVDDVAFLRAAVAELAARYGVDASRVFGVGHSNGAMMTQRLMCETLVLAAGVSVSGGLETGASSCPDSKGKRILAIHGAEDQNVPLAGGVGTKGLSHTNFASEAASARVWQASGASYELLVVPGADHAADNINAQLLKTGQPSMAQTIARFFGLGQ